ncbi:hypothetical protein PHYSODRAFT_340051 [Phytophthora sojae]|uniref:Tyr recombinase domain-containing protein n=1 Tax=Phytophthora sojae (strain P6497) TaxID=1094619 RepID=G5A8K7_PHYSP|nr:hypothetical protein PHYSODRAFT_340051 [Phytophthora sojae]EGZ08233.1 hypothetical protein PHYSODRAFT_340051 [Phytophthora sojae]|eukprot:XP_009536405.1 hypothetical protein PHYSODRAFT_340051 [Phytophthora sojae]
MGVRHFFLATGRTFHYDHPQIRMLLKGISRRDTLPQRKAPVSIRLLEACFTRLSLRNPADQTLWGALCMSFFFLFRRSEIVSVSAGRFRWFAIRAFDVAVLDAGDVPTLDPIQAASVHVRLRGSKTNQRGSPSLRMLRRSGHKSLCPVLGALLMLKAHGSLPSYVPIAVYENGDGRLGEVSANGVANTIRTAPVSIGHDPSKFSTHSLRSGGATHMYRAGVDALTIQFHGRWVSDTFKIFTRICSESVASLASNMIRGSQAVSTLP